MIEAIPHLTAVDEVAAEEHRRAPSHDGVTPPSGRAVSARFITDVIVELGMVRRETAEEAIRASRSSDQAPEQILLASGQLTADQLARAIAERFGLDHVDLGAYSPDLTAVNLISAAAARRYEAVPIGFDGPEVLLVAMADPANVLALDDLRLMTGCRIRPLVASHDDIAGVIARMSRLDDAVAEAVEEEDDQELAAVTEIHESAEDAPIIKLVNSIVAEAVEQGASDIHFEPEGRDMRVRFRIDGVLDERTTIPRRMVPGVISRVKIMADLDISERRVPQDGRVGLKVEDHSIDVRVVTMPSVRGEGLALRLLDKRQAMIGLEELGMREEARELFMQSVGSAYGAVLATGPTGSGKSTTLYAALNRINSIERKIITIEDPVEYQLPGVTQLQTHSRAGLTFASGLRSMLRADPDVIMVGEIRDSETARIAVEAALTGHLVLSTLHTNDAPSAITRLTEMGIETFLTASALKCVVAQRLVRQLCRHCKRRALLDVEALRSAGFRADFDIEAYEAAGCPRCSGTGYRGRTGLYEVMTISDEIRALAIERASADQIRQTAVAQGMRLMREDGLDKVRLGITSIAEVARVT